MRTWSLADCGPGYRHRDWRFDIRLDWSRCWFSAFFFWITVIRRWYALFAGSASECSITGLPVLGAKLDERVWTCKIQSPYSDIRVEKEISKQAEVHVELKICKPRMSTSETFGASRRWKRCYLQLEVMMSTFQSQWVAAGAMLSWCWGSY